MPMSPAMPSIPPDLRAAAEASDEAVGASLAGLLPRPERPYNPKVVTGLAKAIAAAAALMGLDLKPAPYTEPVPELDADMVRFLAMVDAAAKDYGSPLPIPLAEVRGDNELTAITAHLMGLAKDRDFKEFLNMPIEEENTEVEVKVKPGRAEVEEKEDFDFASRMR